MKEETLKLLDERISICERCQELCEHRQKNNYLTVPGEGNPNATIMFIGEGPDQLEAEQGKPFSNKSSKILDDMIAATGHTREEVLLPIALNVILQTIVTLKAKKYKIVEVLDSQIKTVNPEWLVLLGKAACENIIGTPLSMAGYRSKIREYNGCKVICTYSPVYLLQLPKAKEWVWKDLQPLLKG